MQKYTTILFDADETLLDFKRSEHEAVKDVLLSFGLPVTDEVIHEYSKINESMWKALERGEIEKSLLYTRRWEMLCKRFDFVANAQEMSRSYIKSLSGKTYIFPNAEEVCEKLSKYCRLYIITNGHKKVQEGRLKNTRLITFFDDIFISEDIGYEKPNIEYFEAIEKLIPDFCKEQTLVVGDSLTSDMAGGIAYGLDTCWYNPHKKSKPEGMNLSYVINQLSEIEEIIL